MLVVVVGKTVGTIYVVMCLRSVLLQVSVMYNVHVPTHVKLVQVT